MIQVLPRWLRAAAVLFPAFGAYAQSPDPLPPETRLVGVSGAPSTTQSTFTIAAPAQNLTVTLTDLETPAELSSATVVVTQAGAIVGEAVLSAPATTANFAVTNAVGDYTLYVFGAPNASYSVGTFTVCVAPTASPSNCIQNASISGNISADGASADPTVTTVSATLTVVTAGTYTFTYQDDQFPVALNVAPNLALFQGSQVIQLGIQSGATINLSPGTYTLLAIARADQTAKAGLYGVNIAGPGTPLLNSTYPVGTLAAASATNNPSTQTLTLNVTDFQFPAPLESATAAVTAGSSLLGTASNLAAAGTSNFNAPAGTLGLWKYAKAGTGSGTYAASLASSTTSLLQTAGGVSSGSALAYAYVTPSLAAGSYQATAADFQFPLALSALQFAVAQNGVILRQATSASTLNFTTSAAGPVIIIAGVTPQTGGNGIFDVNVETTGASPQLLFDQTQAASLTDLFDTQTINLGTSGNYNVTLTDLDFPAQFQDLDLIVSTGGVVLGKIIGGGTFPIAASPGAYQLTFIATPASAQQYGMYSLQIVNAPPTVTLQAAPTTVAINASTTLSWTTTNATSCTGSGGNFSGSQSIVSGSLAVAVAATTTYTLTCTGAGGSASQSVTVTATQASSGGGGGGEFGMGLLSLLALLAATRLQHKDEDSCAE